MDTATTARRRKAVAVRGRRPGSLSSASNSSNPLVISPPAESDVTATESEKATESEDVASVTNVQEDHEGMMYRAYSRSKAKQMKFRRRRRPLPLCPPNYIEHNLYITGKLLMKLLFTIPVNSTL